MAIRPDVLLRELNKTLDHMPRTGWDDHGVLRAETIGAHQRDVGKITALYAPRHLSPKKAKRAIEMAPRHDTHEGVMRFDLTPTMGFSKIEINELTQESLVALRLLPRFGNFIADAIEEFEEGITTAASFTQGADRLQMAKEALRIELAKRSPWSMQPFFDYVDLKLQNSSLYEVFLTIEKLRPDEAKDKPVLVRAPLPPEKREAIKAQALANIASFRRKLGYA